MKRSCALSALLEDLSAEDIYTEVEVLQNSKAILYIDEEAAADEDGVEISADECKLLFANRATVERFLDVLEEPQDASLAFFDVGVPGPILELLERNFVAVDEG